MNWLLMPNDPFLSRFSISDYPSYWHHNFRTFTKSQMPIAKIKYHKCLAIHNKTSCSMQNFNFIDLIQIVLEKTTCLPHTYGIAILYAHICLLLGLFLYWNDWRLIYQGKWNLQTPPLWMYSWILECVLFDIWYWFKNVMMFPPLLHVIL